MFDIRLRNIFRGKISEDTLKLLHMKGKIFTNILCLSGVSFPLGDPQDSFLEVERFHLLLHGLHGLLPGSRDPGGATTGMWTKAGWHLVGGSWARGNKTCVGSTVDNITRKESTLSALF